MNISLRQPFSYNQLGGRSNQEDSRYPDADRPSGESGFYVVCDGVGGQDKGEVASKTVCEAMAAEMSAINLAAGFGEVSFQRVLTRVYERFHRVISSETRDMATTLTFVSFSSDGVLAAHIGDSRIYHYRPGVGIMYRSEDHSLVNALVKAGQIKAEEAKHHPQSNIITRCISYVASDGRSSAATVAKITDVCRNDYFILCTDGVLDGLDESVMAEILDSDMSDYDKCEAFAGLSRGSHDNNTLYMIAVDGVAYDAGEEARAVEMVEVQLDYPSAAVARESKSRGGFLSRLFRRKK